MCLNHSRHTEESFPVPPSGPPLVCLHDQHGSTHGAHLAREGRTGLREAEGQEPSRKEHVARTGPCPQSGLCPASHMPLVTSLLPEMSETPRGIPRWKGFSTPGIQNLNPSEADRALLPVQAGLRDLSLGFP